ncbi:MAG: hypothetical protein PHI49_07490 [Halothiobacillaceae bacterium]|jgi:hypothetical protein|nr:hypothetical protein [Halothiobacillaceae bacterium]MDY0050738.1 hypothetical protein [Halothiobacillaceae bacterium]
MNATRLFALLLLAVTGTALVGCGPIYRTEYRYTPPQDMAGKQCINQCGSIREMCRSTAENRAAQERASCQQNASIRYAACVATAKDDSARRACNPNAYCNREADTSHCEREYRQCYQGCGGKIDSYQVCEFGC